MNKNSCEDSVMGHKKSKLFDEKKVMKDFLALTSNQIEYICHQTNFIDKEVVRRHAQFLKIAKDGRMTREQFIATLQEIWSRGNVQKFADYLFNLCDPDQQEALEFSEFIVLNCQLVDGKSYLGFLFDMLDTREKGYLPREKVEALFAALFELIGLPSDEQSDAYISQQQIVHLIQAVDGSQSKRLSRAQFMNIRNTSWTDESDGVGTLLIEHTC